MKTLGSGTGRAPAENDDGMRSQRLLIDYLAYAVGEIYLLDQTAGLLVESAIHRLKGIRSEGVKGAGTGIQ
ncbi:hypothetical protein [Azorhizobium sp. AG788]|uniref:hypothetical protein n=1 Tax=Azorhizobium sp. AG788 TaxID=2183897 RepID=UPI003138C93E